jgi:hypothetical protein
MKWLSGVLVIYGLANLAMAVQAAVKSPISLIAGTTVAALAFFGAWYGLKNPKVGYLFGVVAAILPAGRFVSEMVKANAVTPYPHLLGTILSSVVLICLAYGHFAYHRQSGTPGSNA